MKNKTRFQMLGKLPGEGGLSYWQFRERVAAAQAEQAARVDADNRMRAERARIAAMGQNRAPIAASDIYVEATPVRQTARVPDIGTPVRTPEVPRHMPADLMRRLFPDES